jgi:hemolysin D
MSMTTIAFEPSAASLLSRRVSLGLRLMIYLVIGLFAAALCWSILASIDITVQAPAILRPVGEIVKVQTPTGGRVVQINVREGQRVSSGEALVNLKRDDLDSSLSQALAKQDSIEQKRNHIESELRKLDDRKKLTEETYKQRERSAKISVQKQELDHKKRVISTKSSLASCAAELDQRKQQYVRLRTLWEKHVVSTEEASRALADLKIAEAAYNKAVAEVEETDDAVRLAQQELQLARDNTRLAVMEAEHAVTEARQQLVDLRGEMTRLEREIAHLRNQIEQCVIRAPASGTIVDLRTKHAGEVIDAGGILLMIVPENVNLEVESHVQDKDIAFVQTGQPAKVRLAAFPYGQYGLVEGHVESVSRDVLMGNDNKPAFVIRCKLDRQTIQAQGREQKLRPGMTAQIDIVTHRQSPISLLTSKLKNWKESL